MPEVDEVIEATCATAACSLPSAGASAALKDRAYDRAIVLPNTVKSALIPFFAGVPCVPATGDPAC
jgi:heptosyltransferase-2